MHFSFQPRGQWNELNEKLTTVLGLPLEKNQARLYRNCVEALLESAVGFYQQFSSKKKFYYFKNFDPHFDLAVTALSKTGLEGKALTLEQLKDLAWVETLDRESGVVFIAEDNPVTGEVYDISALLAKLIEKNVFRIRLSHSKHLLEPVIAPDRNEIRVLQLPPQYLNGCAVTLNGERGRFGALLGEATTPVTATRLEAFAQNVSDKKIFALPSDLSEMKSRVESFEAQKTDGLHFYFQHARPGHERLYDRTAFYWLDMDGHAFLEALALELGQPLAPMECELRFETSSLSRWGGLKTMQWLGPHGLSPEAIRGFCVIDQSLLGPGFQEKFLAARAKVLKAQHGH